MQEVTGSSPVPSTKTRASDLGQGLFLLRLPPTCVGAGRYRTRTATTTTAACGRNREELLGPRSDFSKPCQVAAEKSGNATRKALSARCRCSQLVGTSTGMHAVSWRAVQDSNSSKAGKFSYVGMLFYLAVWGILGSTNRKVWRCAYENVICARMCIKII